jgi:hypothetical protein
MSQAEEDEPTCGKGLAKNAVMPERMARLLHATANVLENHIRSLNREDSSGNREIEAYERLVRDHRVAAMQAGALADAMRSYRGLPAAEHDMSALGDARSVEVMDALVRAEEDLLSPLREFAAEHGEMLQSMKQR